MTKFLKRILYSLLTSLILSTTLMMLSIQFVMPAPKDFADKVLTDLVQPQMIEDVLKEDPAQLKVCENLGANLEAGIAESYKFPIKSIVTNKSVQDLIKEMLRIHKLPKGDTSTTNFYEKLGFYFKFVLALKYLYQNKRDLEDLGNHSTHLVVMSRMAAQKPPFAHDSRLLGLCNQIQNSLKAKDELDLHEERKALVTLIKQMNFDFKDLEFDPQEFINIGLAKEDNQMKLSFTRKEKLGQ